MSRRIVLDCAPYRMHVCLYVGLTEEQLRARIRRDFKLSAKERDDLDQHKVDLEGRNGHTLLNKNWAAIWLKQWKRDNKWLSVFVHELFHVVSFVLQDRGLKLTEETDEAYAYLLQSLIGQALKRLS